MATRKSKIIHPRSKIFYLLVAVFIGSGRIAMSQNEAKKWCFGNYCVLDFTTNPPTSMANGALATWEGCSSIADASGNLLFYTNGVKVWNSSHALMANGTGLFGDNTSSQSALIVKQPGSSTIYFVFTTDGAENGLNYSVVDMSLAAGMGSVTIKNIPLSASSTERLCGTKHCNGTDIWVISHDNSSTIFRANLVTAAGVNTTAVLSAVGTGMYGTNSVGCMKVSPNGKKLGTSLFVPFSFELYDFNSATGALTNPLNLPVSLPGYGCEFSPDGTKFYGTLWGQAHITNRLSQWDLCAGSDQAIIASVSFFNATHAGQLQLGPDGKIYQARATDSRRRITPELSVEQVVGESALGVIHNPNVTAASINFNNTGQAVNPALSMLGLPNFVSGFYKTPVAQFTYSVNPPVNCAAAFFSAPPLINATCSATSYTINNLLWLFGDPASGSANTATLINPGHVYPDAGIYNVSLVLYNACGGVIDTLKQQVVIDGALTNNPSSYSICAGQSLTLAAGSAPSYTWSTGTTAGSMVITPTANTTYSVSYTDTYGCLHKSVQTVTVNSLPLTAIKVTGKDTLCEGNMVTLTAVGAVVYSWNNGSTNSAITVTPGLTTTYTVTGTSFEGCQVAASHMVVVKPAPIPPIVTANTLVCDGSSATAVAQGTDTYVWSNGTHGATLTIVPTIWLPVFSVKATYPNGCWRYNVVRYKVVDLPFVWVAGSTTLCAGQTTTLTVTGASTYSWSNGLTTNPATLAPVNSSTYTVTATDTNNCSNTATVSITVKSSSVFNATLSPNVAICEGQSAFLSAGGGNQYDWEPATALVNVGNNAVIVTPSVSTVYSVTASTDNACGITKTVVVSVNPKPQLFVGRDTVFNLKEPMFITASGTGTITWVAGEGISCPACLRTQVFPSEKTCYWAQALGDNGCVATDRVCVDLGTEYAIYIPNSFTPNHDGLNDLFQVSGFGLSDISLKIYDRWGDRIFESTESQPGWNGTNNGQLCKTDTYIWVVDFKGFTTGRHEQKTGYVTLLR